MGWTIQTAASAWRRPAAKYGANSQAQSALRLSLGIKVNLLHCKGEQPAAIGATGDARVCVAAESPRAETAAWNAVATQTSRSVADSCSAAMPELAPQLCDSPYDLPRAAATRP